MKQGSIYMVSLNPAVGREQFGHRPVLVITPERFNAHTRLPVIVPITNGGQFAIRSGFTVPLAGTRTTGVIRCDQPRVLDIEDRGGRYVEQVPQEILTAVLQILQTILQIRP